MAKKKVTLYIDDTNFRLLVTQGQMIKEYTNLALEPGLVKNNVITNEDEVSARIQQLFKDHGIKTRKVAISISGLYCLSRPVILPPVPKEVLGEVVTREARKLLPMPLEKLYLSWQNVPAPAGKSQVFLTAVPRKTIDALFKTLHQAGLNPNLVNLKPLLLTKLVEDATGIIIDVQNSTFDVVVVSEGIPQPVRTIQFANEELSWAEKLPVIVSDTERTIAFFNTNNPEKPLDANAPIFASGELLNEPELRQTLSQKTGHPVVSLPSPLEYSGNPIPGQYMTNIALALPKIASGKRAGPSVANLNVLPSVYQPKGISLTNVLAMPAAVILAGLFLTIFVMRQSTSADIASLQSKITTAEQQLRQKTSQRQELEKNISQIEKQLSNIKTEIAQFAAAIGTLEKQTTGVNRDLKVTMDALPGTIKLKNISHSDNLLSITGQTPDEKELLAYVDKLGASGIFADVTVTSIVRNSDNTMDFTLLGNHAGQKIAASSLEIAVKTLPPEVSILKVNYGKGSMTIAASTFVQDSILSYIRRLEQSGQFRDIIVTDMTKKDSGELKFSLILKTGE